MAKRTFVQVNSVTGAVYGTLAYDFDSPAYLPEEEQEVRREPRRRSSQTGERDWVREELSPGGDGLRRPGILSAVSTGITVLSLIAAAVLVVMLLLAKVELVKYSDSALKLEREIETLQGQNDRLTVQYEQVFNLKEVEQAAVEMGMQKPRDDQIFYLSGVASADKAVRITRDDVHMFALGVEDIVSSAQSLIDRFNG